MKEYITNNLKFSMGIVDNNIRIEMIDCGGKS